MRRFACLEPIGPQERTGEGTETFIAWTNRRTEPPAKYRFHVSYIINVK